VVHGVKFPSAGILTVSLAITTNLQARCHPRNQMKSSAPALFLGIGEPPGQNRICLRRRPFPISIAINSQLQEGSKRVRLHGKAE
jgi:hypothetical protein